MKGKSKSKVNINEIEEELNDAVATRLLEMIEDGLLPKRTKVERIFDDLLEVSYPGGVFTVSTATF